MVSFSVIGWTLYILYGGGEVAFVVFEEGKVSLSHSLISWGAVFGTGELSLAVVFSKINMHSFLLFLGLVGVSLSVRPL